MEQITIFDILLLVIIATSTLFSLMRGFVKEAMSLLIWGSAFILGIQHWNEVAEYIIPTVTSDEIRKVVGFFLIFLLVLLFGGIINYIITKSVRATIFGTFDRGLGMMFGLLRGGLICLVLSYFIAPNFNTNYWWKQSKVLPYLHKMAVTATPFLPEYFSENVNFDILVADSFEIEIDQV